MSQSATEDGLQFHNWVCDHPYNLKTLVYISVVPLAPVVVVVVVIIIALINLSLSFFLLLL